MLVVGSVAFDTLRLPSGTHERVLGGSATYAGMAASLFVPVELVAVVGDDFPAEAVELLKSKKIDLAGLERTPGKSFFWEGVYSDNLSSRETLITELNVFADFDPKVPAAYQQTPYVMLGNIDPTLQMRVLDQVQGRRFVIADTMNYWIDSALDNLKAMLKRIDVLVINEEEARQLSGVHNIVRAAKDLHAMGPKCIIIKRGEYGALMFYQSELFVLPAHPTEDVVDPTGAGDTFAGGFLGFVAYSGNTDSSTLRKAVIYGSAVASLCVEGVGTSRLKTVTQQDLAARAERFRTGVVVS